MRAHWRPVFLVFCALSARPAAAEPSAIVSVERHFTSNAFDSPFARADWYTLLRGSLGHTFQQRKGSVRVGAEFQATRYGTYGIEDDTAAALAVDVHRRLGEKFEIRGTLSYGVVEEGDDLEFGPLAIGTSTRKHIVGGRLQFGADLGNAAALVLEVAESFEKAGDTSFEQDIFLPAKLEPDTNRLKISAALSRKNGGTAFGALASLNLVSVEKIGFPPSALSFAEFTLKGEARHTGEDGTVIGLALGAQLLRGAGGLFTGLRPTYQALFVRPLPKGFELRGSVTGAFDTVDSDDPLCSWLQRGELEFRFRPTEKLVFGGGAFAEAKENLLFENRELSRGVYGEVAYDAGKRVTLVFRADFATTLATVVETRKRTTDIFVGIRTKI